MADGGVSWPSDLELKLNLNAIKKCDQFVVNIIDTASQVALYKFQSETQAWEKTDVEGALFVYLRSTLPKYSFFIMNRLNMNNMAEAVTKEIEFKQQDPFLLFRNKTSGIYGIWFYDSQECTKLSNLLIRLSTEEPSEQQPPTSNPELNHKQQSKEGIDILSMLTNAQEKYEKKTTEPSSTKAERKSSVDDQKQHFLQQNQEQMDQLKQLIKGNEQANVKQRAYSSPGPIKPSSSIGSLSSSVESDLSNMKHSNSPVTQINQIQQVQMFNSPDRSTLPRKLFQAENQENVDNSTKSTDQSVTLAASLMSPMAFKTTAPPTPPFPKPIRQKPEISPLTPDQLVQAMMYLMKNDSDFVKKLHEAYLHSLHDLLPT